jgi:hypothetical protein
MKLIVHLESAKDELYDLDADPREKSPLPLTVEKNVRRRLLDRARIHIQESLSAREPEMRLRARLRDIQLELSPESRNAGAQG